MPITSIPDFTVTADEVALSGASSYDIEPGTYDAKLVDVSNHNSKAGNNGLKWTFNVEGANFDLYTMFTAASLWKLNEVLGALGIDIKEGYSLGEIDFDLYIGSIVTGSIILDEDEFSEDVDAPARRVLNNVYRKVDPAEFAATRESYNNPQEETYESF